MNPCPNLIARTSAACTTLYGCGLDQNKVSEFDDCYEGCEHFRVWMRKREDVMEWEAMHA